MPQVKFILIAIALALGWGAAVMGRKPEPGSGWQGGKKMDAASRPAKAEVPLEKAEVPLAKMETRYLALGDSYTIGESVGPDERYPAQVRRLLAAEDHLDCGDPEIIAVTGWTTGNLLEALADAEPGEGDGRSGQGGNAGGLPGRDARTQRGTVYDAVSLLIGVNNQYQGRSQAEYREQFTLLLQKSIRLAGNRPSHVLVLSIPDYSVTPFARMQGRDTTLIAAQIDSFNRINYELARAYHVSYVDVTAASRKAAADPSLIAVDGLHFSGKEYGAWAMLMEPVLKEILKAGH
jgi:lysophospholipase L1-like esterase